MPSLNADLNKLTGRQQDLHRVTGRAVSDSASAIAIAETVKDLNVLPRLSARSLVEMTALNAGIVNSVYLEGRQGLGDGGAGTFEWISGDQSVNVAADPARGVWVAPSAAPTGASGAWRRVYAGSVLAIWFGVTPDYNPDNPAASTDNTAAFAAARTFCLFSGAALALPAGGMRVSQTVDFRKMTVIGAADCGRSFSLLSDADAELRSGRYSIIVPRGLPRIHVINNMVTECELSGGVLANPSAGEAYAASSEGRLSHYRQLDTTNQDAVGATPATPKPFNAGIVYGHDAYIRGVIVQPTRADGGYIPSSADMTVGGLDVGAFAENPYYATLTECRIAGGFRWAAVLHVNHNAGDGYTPQGDRHVFDRCTLEGPSALTVATADRVLVTGVTAASLSVKWFRSHRFPSAGTVSVGGATYAYTGLSFAAGDPGDLTFTGVTPNPVTAGVTAGVSDLMRGSDANDLGIGEMKIKDSFIRSFTHPSLKQSTDAAFSDRLPALRNMVEIRGARCRGIRFEGCTFHGREDVAFFLGDCGDILIDGYMEPKNIGGAASSIRVVALSVAAMNAGRGGLPYAGAYAVGGCRAPVWPESWNQVNTTVDCSPTFRVTTGAYGRFGAVDGLCEPEVNGLAHLDYVLSQRDGTAATFKAPWTREQKHPFQWRTATLLGSSSSVRASMDRLGNWQFGAPLATEADLSNRFTSSTMAATYCWSITPPRLSRRAYGRRTPPARPT
jgi:hypothetical protein